MNPASALKKTLEGLNSRGYQIYFMTARTDQQGLMGTKQHLELIDITNRWIKRHFPYAKDIFYSEGKSEYANNFLCLVDDYVEHCQNWTKAGGQSIIHCPKKKHNLPQQDNIPVINCWQKGALLEQIKKIELSLKEQ